MAKKENKSNKIPGSVIAILVVIVAVIAFIPTVYMPYKNKKPQYDSEHQEALDTIQYLEDSIADQANIEAEIADLNAQWDKYREDMFVEPSSALKDLNTNVDQCGILLDVFRQGDAQPDESGTVTSEGNPLYYISLHLESIADRDQLHNFLKYVEVDSVGAYYVKNLTASPAKDEDVYRLHPDLAPETDTDTSVKSEDDEKDESDTDKKKTSDTEKKSSDSDEELTPHREEVLSVKMDIYLYYFNQDIVIAPEVTDTDTSSQ